MADDELDQLLKKLSEMLPNEQISNDLNLIISSDINSIDKMFDTVSDKSAKKNLRLVICWILGRSENTKATDVLLECARDDDEDIRAEAVKSLGSQGKNEAALILIHLMMHDDSAEVRKSAAYALGLIGDLRAFDMLAFKLFDQNEVAEVRGMAAEALGDLGDKFAVDPLIQALKENSNEVKFWAVNSLGRLGKIEGIAPLKKLINELNNSDNDLSLKKEAGEAISKIEEMNQIE